MKLAVAPAALAELHDAAAFYTLKANVELGLAFVAEFERTANFVLDNPLVGAVFRGDRRSDISSVGSLTASSIRSPLRNFAFLPSLITGEVLATGRTGSSCRYLFDH
jgi:hypothetical protein